MACRGAVRVIARVRHPWRRAERPCVDAVLRARYDDERSPRLSGDASYAALHFADHAWTRPVRSYVALQSKVSAGLLEGRPPAG